MIKYWNLLLGSLLLSVNKMVSPKSRLRNSVSKETKEKRLSISEIAAILGRRGGLALQKRIRKLDRLEKKEEMDKEKDKKIRSLK